MVLTCLYRTQGCYQFRFSKLGLKSIYVLQIFQVGIPAGIQSTVINFSNVLLQSSVNSFGSIAMAGYTAANNIFGFLYTSVNSVTQACMSFASQNYGAGKTKRMDRVLIDCLILSCAFSLTMGCCAWFFGPQLLQIYTESSAVISCGVEILSFTTVTYFLCGIMDLIPGRAARDGTFCRAHDFIDYRNCRNANCLDFLDFPVSPFSGYLVPILSGVLDSDDSHAGHLLFYRSEERPCGHENAVKGFGNIIMLPVRKN